MIDSFRGDYAFLSNFYPCLGSSVEHLFQAAKTHDLDCVRAILAAPTPADAKRLGRRVPLVKGWDGEKRAVMLSLLRAKFAEPELRTMLLATDEALLIEGNTWGDRYWGKCNGVGENWLGRMLMRVRAELQP